MGNRSVAAVFRLPARIVCGLLIVAAFVLIGPPSEHEPAAWMLFSVGAVLAVFGIGIGGSVIGFASIAMSIGVLREHVVAGVLLGLLLGFLSIVTEPWGTDPRARRPRSATAALVYGIAALPVLVLDFVAFSENMRHPEITSAYIAFSGLAVGGVPLLAYLLLALQAQKLAPDVGGNKRVAFAAVVLAMLGFATLAVLSTFVLNHF